MLLGAGASVSAGMLSAWGVQCDLIRQIASVEGVEIPDGDDGPYDWYVNRFERDPAYDTLLADLSDTTGGRQVLLRSYFEPDETEREQGIKQPADAHRALARLVADGYIRVIITLNFDHLIEDALREAGLRPTIIRRPSDMAGMIPLHAQRQGVVIHLHGDYLDPDSMRNTPEELSSYEEEVDKLLDQVFDEYGLISQVRPGPRERPQTLPHPPLRHLLGRPVPPLHHRHRAHGTAPGHLRAGRRRPLPHPHRRRRHRPRRAQPRQPPEHRHRHRHRQARTARRRPGHQPP
ncbi:SIR2 family protein [Streptomyces avidinii]|uniref:SIR2 family protein n=1 Tax=Streptomyces avidinii TaxID=1895 RepID=UPI00386CE77F|nr:SIR2 family protein [Streptomyces avidinii]